MKALTLTQPWASLIAVGAKLIETRSWRTNYRGKLLIHAAKTADRDFTNQPIVQKYLQGQPPPLGAFVAVCDLVDCKSTETTLKELAKDLYPPDEEKFGNYRPHRYAWILDNVQPLPEPVYHKGNRMLWNPPAAIVQQVMLQSQQPTGAVPADGAEPADLDQMLQQIPPL